MLAGVVLARSSLRRRAPNSNFWFKLGRYFRYFSNSTIWYHLVPGHTLYFKILRICSFQKKLNGIVRNFEIQWLLPPTRLKFWENFNFLKVHIWVHQWCRDASVVIVVSPRRLCWLKISRSCVLINIYDLQQLSEVFTRKMLEVESSPLPHEFTKHCGHFGRIFNAICCWIMVNDWFIVLCLSLFLISKRKFKFL